MFRNYLPRAFRGQAPGVRGRRRRSPFRPALFDLEDRVVPTTYLVTNVNDAGTGTLRQAIIDANANASADTIVFSDGSNGSTNFNAGVNTITLAKALPAFAVAGG